jgi:hypothetical protein
MPDATTAEQRCYIECRLSNGVRPGEYGYRFSDASGGLRVGVAPHAACLDRDGMPFAAGVVLDSEATHGLVAGRLLGHEHGVASVAVVDGLSETGTTVVQVRAGGDRRWMLDEEDETMEADDPGANTLAPDGG